MTQHLHQVHSVAPIVLIDEYDAGIHSAYTHGFYDEAIQFFSSFFLSSPKDNPHLERALLTGILRGSRESIFSELNNVGVYSLLDLEFNTSFGFTQEEVDSLLERSGLSDMIDDVRAYSNGYEFGRINIYNPWSILNLLSHKTRDVIPYWVGTSANTLIKEMLIHCRAVLGQRLQRVANEFDVAPKAWNAHEMATIPDLYGAQLPAPEVIRDLSRALAAEARPLKLPCGNGYYAFPRLDGVGCLVRGTARDPAPGRVCGLGGIV